jgi:methylphosphotriester-DNA--protein-cysteine methyltransferase
MGPQELALVGLAGSGLGTALSVPMVWPPAGRPAEVRLLGAGIFLMSAIAALISARLAGFLPASAGVEHAVNVIGLCAIPLLVLYTRSATDDPLPLGRALWWWAPAGAYGALALVRTSLGVDSRVPFVWLLPVMLGFTAVSVATIWTHRGRGRAAIVPPAWVVAFIVMVNAAQIVRMEFGHVAPVRAIVPLVLSLGFLALATFATWRTIAAASARGARPAMPRYERSGVDDPRAADLLARIDAAMTRDRLFARADLTLTHLAAAVDATPHEVSEALNRCARVSFSDFINRRRVDDVKAQLLDPASDRFTIEGIGVSAGFGSRSALYAAFRRLEGTTPTAFRPKAGGTEPAPSSSISS